MLKLGLGGLVGTLLWFSLFVVFGFGFYAWTVCVLWGLGGVCVLWILLAFDVHVGVL